MDEEAQQPKKITAANLFASVEEIQDVAGRALTSSQENLTTIRSKLLLEAFKLVFEEFKAFLATLSIDWIDPKKLLMSTFLDCSNSSSSILSDTLFLLSLKIFGFNIIL